MRTPRYSKPHPQSPLGRQEGAALIAALIILMVLTMIGAATVHTALMQEKMANAMADRQRTFQAAEWALRWGEQQVWNSNPMNVLTSSTTCQPWSTISDSTAPNQFILRVCTGRLTEPNGPIPCGPASSNQKYCHSFLIVAEARPQNDEATVRLESILLLESN